MLRMLNCLLLFVVIFFTACGNEQIFSSKEIKQSEVQIDLQALTQLTVSGEMLKAVSVVDLLRLRVLPSDGNEQIYERNIGQSDFLITIDVEVPTGLVEFEAEILSNNDTQIYAGAASRNVQEDNFEVQLQMDILNAVLAVAPDTLVVDPSGTFWVLNKGSEILEWQITEVESCGNFPCLEFELNSGKILPGDSTGVFTRSRLNPGTNSAIRIVSNVGHVELNVHTADST